MVNWARLPDGAAVGGGVNGYLRELAVELARLGHDVCSLSGGMAYVPDRWPVRSAESDLHVQPELEPPTPPRPGPPAVRRMPDYRHNDATPPIRVFEMVNSPVVAPAIFQFHDPRGEIGQPALEAEFLRFVRLLRPEVVHVHNIEGWSPLCVECCRMGDAHWPGARVVFSLHNYHTLCPQVYLVRRDGSVCRDFENGHACVDCVDHRPDEVELRIRGFLRENRQALALAREAQEHAAQPWHLRARRAWHVPPPRPDGQGTRGPDDVSGPYAGDDPISRAPPPDAAPPQVPQSVDPVDNAIAPEPRGLREPNDYALRRRAMIDMLSRCDVVHAVSSFVSAKFMAMGVARERLRTISIGTRMVDLVGPSALQAPAPSAGPLRMLFIGYHNRYKGLQVLVDALETLPAEVARRVSLAVHAKDLGPLVGRLDALRGRLAEVLVEGAYEASRVPALCRGRHVGVVPSIWWDNGPQTVLEFLACGLPVLGANVGGIPDQVRDGENGLLFRANDRADLARAITRLSREDGLVERLRAGVRPPKSMPEHAREMARVYEEIAHRG